MDGGGAYKMDNNINKPERLDKILTSTGRWSRKEARNLIQAGRVQVGGGIVRNPAEKIEIKTRAQIPASGDLNNLNINNKNNNLIFVDGELILYRREVWIMMNKPAGYLSATEDGRGAPVVLDLLTPELRKLNLFPVGRLDKDSEGLLLLTNDGQLAHKLLSPKYHVEKIYYIRVSGYLIESDIKALQSGEMRLDGKPCLPADLKILKILKINPGNKNQDKNKNNLSGELKAELKTGLEPESESEALLILREGRYHQAKRMLAALGKPVLYLKRVKFGNLPLNPDLKPGDFRFLTDEELNQLRQRS